jgi:hypothetical protein
MGRIRLVNDGLYNMLECQKITEILLSVHQGILAFKSKHCLIAKQKRRDRFNQE